MGATMSGEDDADGSDLPISQELYDLAVAVAAAPTELDCDDDRVNGARERDGIGEFS